MRDTHVGNKASLVLTSEASPARPSVSRSMTMTMCEEGVRMETVAA